VKIKTFSIILQQNSEDIVKIIFVIEACTMNEDVPLQVDMYCTFK